MKEKKTVFKMFTVTQYDQEAEYLRAQQQKGWKLTRITGGMLYHFEACEPEDVVYQLDYNQDGIRNKDEYVQMFADCGWEYLFDVNGYSYFRKPQSQMEGEEKIFCDDQSRLEMLKRVIRGRICPLIIIFLLIIIPQLTRVQFTAGGRADSFIKGILQRCWYYIWSFCANRHWISEIKKEIGKINIFDIIALSETGTFLRGSRNNNNIPHRMEIRCLR